MKTEFLKHKLAYFLLSLGLVVFVLGFMAVWPNHLYQRVIIGGLVLFYFSWGVMTHLKSEHISRQIVAEYATMSLLAGVVLLIITF